MKTCKKIKLFNLHSTNCNDVYDSLELNGYKEFLPNSDYTRTIFKDCPTREQYRLERSENEFEQGSIYDKFKIVGAMFSKFQVLDSDLAYFGRGSKVKLDQIGFPHQSKNVTIKKLSHLQKG